MIILILILIMEKIMEKMIWVVMMKDQLINGKYLLSYFFNDFYEIHTAFY
jgi:hypothetical protein